MLLLPLMVDDTRASDGSGRAAFLCDLSDERHFPGTLEFDVPGRRVGHFQPVEIDARGERPGIDRGRMTPGGKRPAVEHPGHFLSEDVEHRYGDDTLLRQFEVDLRRGVERV